MTRSAARVDSSLLAALVRIDTPDVAIAETHRRLGAVADGLGVTRPSYERVRHLVRAHRRRPIDPGIGEMLLDIALQNRPPEALIDTIIDRRS